MTTCCSGLYSLTGKAGNYVSTVRAVHVETRDAFQNVILIKSTERQKFYPWKFSRKQWPLLGLGTPHHDPHSRFYWTRHSGTWFWVKQCKGMQWCVQECHLAERCCFSLKCSAHDRRQVGFQCLWLYNSREMTRGAWGDHITGCELALELCYFVGSSFILKLWSTSRLLWAVSDLNWYSLCFKQSQLSVQ